MVSYSYYITNPDTSEVFELQPLSSDISFRLNDYGVLDMTFSFEDLKSLASVYSTTVLDIFVSSYREVYVERNGQRIFDGFVTGAQASPQEGGDKRFSVSCTSFLAILQKAIVGVPVKTYTSTGDGDICWDIIDTFQNSDTPYSDYGITKGSVSNNSTRDRTYRFDKGLDSIRKLTNENLNNAIDIEIDTTRNFNSFAPEKGNDLTNIIFSDKDNSISGYDWQRPVLASLTNKVHVVGEGSKDSPIYVTRTASTSFRDTWGTLVDEITAQNTTETATLNDKGDRYLEENQSPISNFSFSHIDGTKYELSDYSLGDTIYVDIPDLDLNMEAKRIKEITISISDLQVAEISLRVE